MLLDVNDEGEEVLVMEETAEMDVHGVVHDDGKDAVPLRCEDEAHDVGDGHKLRSREHLVSLFSQILRPHNYSLSATSQ